MSDFNLPDFASMADEELAAYHRGAVVETNLRLERLQFPETMKQLADEGKRLDVEKQVLHDVVDEVYAESEG